MADSSLSASGKDEKKVSRVNSFTNFIRSPSRSPKTMRKSSSNPLSRFLFRRKSSKEKDIDSKDEGSTRDAGADDAEDENAPNMVEEVKEVVGTAIDNVHHHNKHTSTEEANDAAVSAKPRDVSSTDVAETKEHKPSLLDKFKEELHVAEHSADHLADKFKAGLGKAKKSFKGDYDKAKEGLESILHIDHKSSEKKPSVDIVSDNKKKPIVEEVKAPSLAKRVQEEVVAVVSSIKDDPKKAETGQEESKEIKGEIKKEDGCVSSLAQGLEKMCAPWSSKKEV